MNSTGYVQLLCVVVVVLISSSSAWFIVPDMKRSASAWLTSYDYRKRSSLSADDCPPVCLMFCPYGNVLNEKGCPECECINPCQDVQCEDDERCVVQPPVGCDELPCHFETSCEKPCPPLCRIYCRNGFVKNDDGCSICKCNP